MNTTLIERYVRYWVVVFVVGTLQMACSKVNESNPPALNFKDSSATLPILDSSNFGVYKAVTSLKGGSIQIFINNGNSEQKAWLRSDSLSDTLICAEPIERGVPIVDALFTGRISSFLLSADTLGNNATISNVFITNVPVVSAVVCHETTHAVVRGYAANFTGSMRGAFNMLVQQQQLKAVAGNSSMAAQGSGLLVGSIFQVNTSGLFGELQFQGSIAASKDYYSGTWNGAGSSGTYYGNRIF
jgi:hypothetical protein